MPNRNRRKKSNKSSLTFFNRTQNQTSNSNVQLSAISARQKPETFLNSVFKMLCFFNLIGRATSDLHFNFNATNYKIGLDARNATKVEAALKNFVFNTSCGTITEETLVPRLFDLISTFDYCRGNQIFLYRGANESTQPAFEQCLTNNTLQSFANEKQASCDAYDAQLGKEAAIIFGTLISFILLAFAMMFCIIFGRNIRLRANYQPIPDATPTVPPLPTITHATDPIHLASEGYAFPQEEDEEQTGFVLN